MKPMNRPRRDSLRVPAQRQIRHGVQLILLALVAGVCIAACGSSSTKTTTTAAATASATTASASNTKLTACLKSKGVTLPSRGAGGGFPGRGTAKAGGTSTAAGGPPSGGAPSGGGAGAPSGSFKPGNGGTRGGGFFGGNSKTAKAITACDKQLGIKATHTFAGGAGGAGGAGRTVPSTATLTKFVACIRTHGYAAMPEASKSTSAGTGFFPKSVESNAAFKKALPSCESLLQTATPQAGTSTT
jgi:hypothetical protein